MGRVDFEGPKVNLLGRLAVRGEEPRSKPENGPRKRPQAGFFHELLARAGGNSARTAGTRCPTAGDRRDHWGVPTPVAHWKSQPGAPVESGTEPNLAHHHQSASPRLEVERQNGHRVDSAAVKNLEPVERGDTTIAVQVLRPEALKGQEPRPRRRQPLDDPDSRNPALPPNHDDPASRDASSRSHSHPCLHGASIRQRSLTGLRSGLRRGPRPALAAVSGRTAYRTNRSASTAKPARNRRRCSSNSRRAVRTDSPTQSFVVSTRATRLTDAGAWRQNERSASAVSPR